jgi:hypothetical protein
VGGFFGVPEGVRVNSQGAWSVGGLPIRHLPSLHLLKSCLEFESEGAFLRDGPARLPVVVEGPAFEVRSLRLDPERGLALVVLDDGSEEPVLDEALRMHETNGRFVCGVRGGRAQALLSRAAHDTLLENVREDDGGFFLAVGTRRLAVRT